MAKIYVSSTYLDLQEYRAQVEKVIRRMGHKDTAMEYYVAEDQRPVDRCLSDVEDCDLYIGIFAWRYGWIPSKKNRKKISITEMEYRQAQKFNKPCLIFLLDGKAAWPPDFIDDDKTQIKKLRNELSESHGTGPGFKTADELGRLVAEAIHNWEKEQGLIQVTAAIPEHNLTTYYAALRKRYNVLALEGLTPPQKEEYLQIQLRSVFVEQSVREDTPPVELPKEVWEKLSREKEIHDEDLPAGITLDDVRKARESYYQKPSQLVLDALTDSKNKYAIILGDPGSGKSTLARYIMLSLIDPALAGDKTQKAFEGYLPLLIELRTFAGLCAEDKCETPLEFLEHLGKTEGWGLTQPALHNHLKGDGRALVIFDGLDEIFEPKLRETITNQIVGFTNAYPKARVIVTSRILGYRRKILSDAGFTHFTLQDLNEEQVRAFITKWYDLAMSDRPDEAKERSERILKSFADQASIHQLAGNPMLLTIMAIIGKHQELPRERWKLYDHAASVLIQHWDVNKHLRDERIKADFIGEDDKKELLRRLAFRMQSGDGGLAGNYVRRADLQEEFETYLKERYSQSPAQAKVIAEAMIQQFRERNFILSLYGANVFGFVHRAFLEYFCASAFVWKFEKTKEMDIEQLKSDVYGKHWEDQSWHEVLRLICGMIDEKWTGEIVDSLIVSITNLQKTDDKDSHEHRKVILVAQCLAEARNIGAISKTANNILELVCVWLDLEVINLNNNRNQNSQKTLEQLAIPLRTILDILPNKKILVEWLQGHKPFEQIVDYAQNLGRFLGTISNGSQDLLRVFKEFTVHPNETYRVLGLFALAEAHSINQNNAELLFEQLYEVAKNDTRGLVRSAATYLLAEKYNEQISVTDLLFNQAIFDKYKAAEKHHNIGVRFVAIWAIIKYYINDIRTLPLLRERAVNDDDSDVRRAAVSALAEHYRADFQTLQLLRERAVQDENLNVRSAAMDALAEYYRADAETLPLLRERAARDDDSDVRWAAVSAIIEHYRESAEALPFLRERATDETSPNADDENDKYYPREAALEAIAKYWVDHPDTLPLLHEHAKNDPTPWLRARILELIVKYYREDEQTLPFLRERAMNDNDVNVRSSVMDSLAEYFKEDAQTLSLLHERATQETSPIAEDPNDKYYPREAALEAIAKYWSDHPDTLPLLRERAEHDPTLWLRERCRELIKEIEGKKKKNE